MPIPDSETPFTRIGGQLAVDRLVDVFYARMSTLPQAQTIRAMHPADLEPVKAILKQFVAQWMGGPQTYSEQRGHPRLRMRHLPFSIGTAERDAWMLCMTGARRGRHRRGSEGGGRGARPTAPTRAPGQRVRGPG